MANDSAARIHLAWGGIVIGLRVNKVTCHHIVDRHSNRKVLVGGDGAKVCWEGEL